MKLSLAYITARREPYFRWFVDSLCAQASADDLAQIQVIVVDGKLWSPDVRDDPHHPDGDWIRLADPFYHDLDRRRALEEIVAGRFKYMHVPPIPSVWQGPFRVTSRDWWACCAARNTPLYFAPDGWLAYCDDVSVLCPGWLDVVKGAVAGNQSLITLGSYRKVHNLVVENGCVMSQTEPVALDSRWGSGRDMINVQAAGSWLYGCSFVGPIEAFLSTNGWPSAWCDGLSFEDAIQGINLEKKGWSFAYSRRMHTIESEEAHQFDPPPIRSDYGVSPKDKSHAVLDAAMHGNGWHNNDLPEGGIRALREKALRTGLVPIMRNPIHEWYSKQPLATLKTQAELKALETVSA